MMQMKQIAHGVLFINHGLTHIIFMNLNMSVIVCNIYFINNCKIMDYGCCKKKQQTPIGLVNR